MSDAAATPTASPTPAPKTDAQPSAVQRANVADRDDGVLSERGAVEFLQKRREARAKAEAAETALRLVPAEETSESADDARSAATPSDESGEPADSENSPDDADEQEPEKVPTWAQKLKAEHKQAHERATALEKQVEEDNAKFAAAHQRVQHAHEDLTVDIKFEREYSAMLEKAIAGAGLALPAFWKEHLLEKHKNAKLEMQNKRGGAVTQTHERAQAEKRAGEQVQTVLADLAKKIPEFDLAKNPETKKWLQARFALGEDGKPVNPGAFKTLEADAIAFAKALRWDRTQKANAQKKQPQKPPTEGQRPTSTTLNGKGTGGGQKRLPAVPQNEKESIAFLAALKAARN